jgi:inner membrane protein
MSDTAQPTPRPLGGGIAGQAAQLSRPALRLATVVALFAVLLPPQCMIAELIEEREARQEEVQREVGAAWGKPQAVLGPVLVVPTRDPAALPVLSRGMLSILPGTLEARLQVEPETRQRGIFSAVVYRARLELRGSLTVPAAEFGQPIRDWREATLHIAASDLRATPTEPALTWNGRAMGVAEAAADVTCRHVDAIRWPLRLEAAPAPGEVIPFSASLDLRGSSSFRLLPAARRTSFEASGPWPTPGFSGSDLPMRSEVGANGFRAEWLTASRLPLALQAEGWCERLPLNAEGQQVSLLEAVPTYRMVNRAAKYAALVLALALLTYVLFELLAKVAIHPVQYGLLGLSLVLFPLLLLAVGEPLGFPAAFGIAAAMVTAQAGGHTAMVTRRPRLALLFTAVLAAMFGFVHVVLSLESYALLAGAVALFAALSVLMVATRGVRWGG